MVGIRCFLEMSVKDDLDNSNVSGEKLLIAST